MLLPLLLCASLACAQTSPDPYLTTLSRDLPPGFRTWTSTAGTTVEAKLVSSSADQVKLEKTDGTFLEVPLTALAPADRALVAKNAPPQTEPKAPAKSASTAATTPPPLPANFPEDPTLDIIPILKRKKTQGVTFSFSDSVSSRTITSNQLKGKYVYVHTIHLANLHGRQLQELKLLHEKYASRGFEIVSINAYSYNNRSSLPERYSPRAFRENLKKAIEDYGITWHISYSTEAGRNPLLEKFGDQSSLNWLLDPEGRLIHTNVISGNIFTTTAVQGRDMLPLDRALKIIFGD